MAPAIPCEVDGRVRISGLPRARKTAASSSPGSATPRRPGDLDALAGEQRGPGVATGEDEHGGVEREPIDGDDPGLDEDEPFLDTRVGGDDQFGGDGGVPLRHGGQRA